MSRSSASSGGAPANRRALDGVISADGRFVAFASLATNLGNGRRVAFWSNAHNLGASRGGTVYVYDRRTDELEPASRRRGGGAANGADPVISWNGRFVAFGTSEDPGGPADAVANIYVYDLKERRTRLASRQGTADGGAGANGHSFYPDISRNGSLVAFNTEATNLGGPLAEVINTYRHLMG